MMAQRHLSHISKGEGPEDILDMKMLNKTWDGRLQSSWRDSKAR